MIKFDVFLKAESSQQVWLIEWTQGVKRMKQSRTIARFQPQQTDGTTSHNPGMF